MEKHKVLTAVHLFLIDKSDRILMSRRYNTGYEDGKYSLIAGHIELNESAKQAMQREAKEESGIDISLDDLHFSHVMYRKRENDNVDDRIDFFFTSSKWNGSVKILEKNKCDDMKWFNIRELPNNTVPYIKKSINEFLNHSNFSEFGW